MGNLNHRLKQMRKFLGKSQEDFGAVGGVSQSTQNRYEQTGTDIPMSYLRNIFEAYGSQFREDWFYHGKGKMLKNSRSPSDDVSGANDLTRMESQIIAEVEQFSEFLKTRPLRPSVKRQLLQLLIESIDQALEQLRNNPDDTSY